ncbi:MAG: 1,4-alpha-glucan branching protein GlgB [Acidimicrobiales bacterium]
MTDSAGESRPTAEDLRLFANGRHERLWEVLGARCDGAGARFAVWAPHAQAVSVIGDWNSWTSGADPLARVDGSGVWAATVDAAMVGSLYKYEIIDSRGVVAERADPMAQSGEAGGGNASRVASSQHVWQDDAWMDARDGLDPVADRISVYEVHLGSWRHDADGQQLSYRELAPLLAEHVSELGFTHVELLPVAEHPYDPSWGYQVTGYYAPTARFGTPDDFRWFVDHLHQRGIGVIVDWVPAHFPKDGWALARFDGSTLYEHEDPLRAEHPDWGTLEFDLTKPEVRCFLIANALYWFSELHVDGLRVDAVASMLYLDYSRGPGEWTPNLQGGNEDLDAVSFLQELNTVVHRVHPGVLTIAEESTAWSGVSRPVHEGGLGFTHKWNMGWMHDTLGYWSTAPSDRRWHHDQLSFGLTYAFAEHFVLPLSHDEVVHLKRPLILKMGADGAAGRFDDLRALYSWMWAHPGKKLLFMGGELAEEREWSHDRELEWSLLEDPNHAGVAALVGALNQLQAAHPALYAGDGVGDSFEWLSVDEDEHSTFAFERTDPGDAARPVVCLANLSDLPRHGYRVGLPTPGPWSVVLRSDDVRFGGSGGEDIALQTEATAWQGRNHSALITLPARTVLYLAPSA